MAYEERQVCSKVKLQMHVLVTLVEYIRSVASSSIKEKLSLYGSVSVSALSKVILVITSEIV